MQTKRPHHHCPIRYNETSICGPSASSEPLPTWSERDIDCISRIKPSQSCEIFTLQIIPHVHNDNVY